MYRTIRRLTSSSDRQWESGAALALSTQAADGRVHFTFVARDLRGGVAVVTRTACVE
jgi:hypothetical protein